MTFQSNLDYVKVKWEHFLKNHNTQSTTTTILTISNLTWCKLRFLDVIKINRENPCLVKSCLYVCNRHCMFPGWPHNFKKKNWPLPKKDPWLSKFHSLRSFCQFFLNWANGIESSACTMWLVWGGIAITCILFSHISAKNGRLYTWLLWESISKMWGLSRSLWGFRYLTKQIPYSWNFALVMYPLVVVVTWIPIGASHVHYSSTCWPWWITIGGHTRLIILTNVKIVDVSPCSPLTWVTVGVPSSPTTICSFGTFCIPVSSPDHIWFGEVIPRSSSTSLYFSNHFLILGSLAHHALAVDKLINLCTLIFVLC